MAGAPGSVDSSSPFFASIAGQAALRATGGKAEDARKKDRAGVRSFSRLVSGEIDRSEETGTLAVPERLVGLPPEKILETLLDEVNSAGDRLKERQTPDAIIAYKDSVRSFVRYVVEQAFEVSEKTSSVRIRARTKKFTQVRIIDEKLEQLAAGILSNQKDHLALLGRIEEINGLLVDLLS